MINKDKVMKALKKLSKDERQYFAGYNMAEVKKQIGLQELAEDALSMLKEQEARVMTLDEAVEGNGCYYVEFQYHPDMGWVKCDFSRMYLDGEVAMLFIRDKNFYQQKEHYGQLWRLWNKRPTYDQRQAVKWE